MSANGAALWQRALLAASLFAVDPAGTGIVVRARAGPVRDRFLVLLRSAATAALPWRTLPHGIPDDRLLGGLDLPATLRAGRPVAGSGLLAEVHGGVLVLPGAERTAAELIGRLGTVLDTGELCAEREGLSIRAPARFGLVALDEGAEPDERIPAALADRLAFHVDLDAVSVRDIRAGADAPGVGAPGPSSVTPAEADDGALGALGAAALALGVESARAWVFALRVARSHAALSGHDKVEPPDLEAAAALVLAPRATRLPRPPDAEEMSQPPPAEAPPEPPESGEDQEPLDSAEPPADLVLEAALAAIPPGLLAALQCASLSRRALAGGKAGAATRSRLRGRPLGAVPGDPRRARIAAIETLRAAAPWQRLRRGEESGAGGRLIVRPQDIRVRRYRQHSETTAIFAVDASGSAALQRLAEAKGAVELLLADCYVRRDRVALVTFRGREAELALPPTRSLVRARRSLAGLPGGGGTPLAAGIETAALLAESLARRGHSAVIVLLTDGRANVARDGSGGRPRALDDALAAAKRVRLAGIPSLLIDTAPQPHPSAARIAEALHARYVPLPHADAARMSAAVREILPAR